MPSHYSLFILRNVLAAPRLMCYLLRTVNCCESPELPMYDAVLRDSVCYAEPRHRRQQVDTSVAASPLGAVWASVVLFCWHFLPIWLPPQVLRSPFPVYFPTSGDVLCRTTEHITDLVGSSNQAHWQHVNHIHCALAVSGKRSDGVTQVPWSRGRCLAWDATYPFTFAVSQVLASSIHVLVQRQQQQKR